MTIWFDKELDKLEKQQKGLHDQYNTLDNPIDVKKAERVLNSNLKYAPQLHQTWQQYVQELETHVKYADEKNTQSHINGTRGAWYTHRSPLGCFMCEDIALRHVMLQVLQLMAKQYPKTSF